MKGTAALTTITLFLAVTNVLTTTLEKEVNLLAAENAIEDKIMKAVHKDIKGERKLSDGMSIYYEIYLFCYCEKIKLF